MAQRKRDEENIQIAIVKFLKFKYRNALFTNTLGGIRTSFKQAVKAKQKDFIDKANKRNYKAIAGYGLNECMDIIDKYFNNEL